MKRIALPLAALAALAACGGRSEGPPPAPAAVPAAQEETPPLAEPAANPLVAGTIMAPARSMLDNIAAAPNLATLTAAIRASDVGALFSGAGPYTVFAPTDQAFARLAPGTLPALLKPENRTALGKVLSYHVVPGAISSAELIRRIAAGGGTATLTTVQGGTLRATLTSNIVTLTDGGGNTSYVETADVHQANGIVHVVNGVLVPAL